METIQRLTAEKEIIELKNKLIKTLQDYSRSQVELWRQVPALAQEADKRHGHTVGRYRMAFLFGHWPISDNMNGLRIELQTGEFFGIWFFDTIELGSLDSILRRLDANEVINLLKNEIQALSIT